MLYPVIAMFFLTFVVWFAMYAQRLRYMAVNKITPQSVATPEAAAAILPEWINRPSDNLKNLFEMPVLFYAVCCVALSMQINDQPLVIMAWGFVLFRVLHSAVHCTSNHVLSRFAMYIVSSLILLGMVIRLTLVAI